MTALDIVGGLAAAVASSALALRAYMLKPSFGDWCSAPTRVWAALLVLSVAAAITALSIFQGRVAATAREVLLLIALAGAAVVLLDNLRRQAPASTRAGD